MELIETYVPPNLRGRGLAEKLMNEAIRYAEENNLKIEPICSYAIYYFIKNKDKRSLLVDWLREKSDEELEKLFEYRRSLELSKK
jgi:predicted GNAT family acetyltransferase